MIRAYKFTDKERLINIFKRNVPTYFDESEVKDFEGYLGQYPETYLTIEQENKIVGGTGYYVKKEDQSGRITWIFFDSEYVGQGLGREAVEYCLALLRKDNNVEKFIVTTSQHAFRFFKKFGYNLIKVEKNHWGLGLDLYEMEMIK